VCNIPYNIKHYVGFEALIALTLKITFFWDAMPCSLVEVRHVSYERTATIFRTEEETKHETNKKQVTRRALFIDSLLNDVFSRSDCILPNCRIISEMKWKD
jgi:hypothetical protein